MPSRSLLSRIRGRRSTPSDATEKTGEPQLPLHHDDTTRPPTLSGDASETATLESHEGSTPKEEEVEPQRSRELYFIPIPKHLRYDPNNLPTFGLAMNALFGCASTFLVANLYWCQPLLIDLSHSFGVTYDEVSRIPTLVQGGYACGLLLITPLGDIVRRRPLILLCTFLATGLTLGLPLTNSISVFEALSFLVGMFSVIPQVLMPFAADLAPPERRASALSIVLAGLLFGVLLARVLAGVIANFVTWHAVYWLAFGLQCSILVTLYFMLPDWPAKNKNLSYWHILYTMGRFLVTEPLLIQSALVNMCSMAAFTNFWVTLTFLLGGPNYNYNTLDIGLFGLVGMFGVSMAPLVGRVIDGLVPWFATIFATVISLCFYSIQLGAGGLSIAAVVITCFGIDVFKQTQQVSVTHSVFGLEPNARARLNAVLIISLFLGQIMGSSAGTTVFNAYGWRASAALGVGWQGFCLLVLSLRGPHTPRYTWFGFKGGLRWRKEPPAPKDAEAAVPAVTEKDEKDTDVQSQTSTKHEHAHDEEHAHEHMYHYVHRKEREHVSEVNERVAEFAAAEGAVQVEPEPEIEDEDEEIVQEGRRSVDVVDAKVRGEPLNEKASVHRREVV